MGTLNRGISGLKNTAEIARLQCLGTTGEQTDKKVKPELDRGLRTRTLECSCRTSRNVSSSDRHWLTFLPLTTQSRKRIVKLQTEQTPIYRHTNVVTVGRRLYSVSVLGDDREYTVPLYPANDR